MRQSFQIYLVNRATKKGDTFLDLLYHQGMKRPNWYAELVSPFQASFLRTRILIFKFSAQILREDYEKCSVESYGNGNRFPLSKHDLAEAIFICMCFRAE